MFQRTAAKRQKLTSVEVAEIRQHYGGGATQGALARHYGVSVGQIGRIVSGESWQAASGERSLSPGEADSVLQRLLQVQQATDGGAAPKEERPLQEFVNKDLAKSRGYIE